MWSNLSALDSPHLPSMLPEYTPKKMLVMISASFYFHLCKYFRNTKVNLLFLSQVLDVVDKRMVLDVDLYLSGESYAGFYIPWIGEIIVRNQMISINGKQFRDPEIGG